MRVLSVFLFLAGFLWVPAAAEAFDKGKRRFGLGFEFGDPTGISAKYYLQRNMALQGGFGFFGWPSGGGVHLDILFESPDAIRTGNSDFDLPIFIGAGVKMGGYAYCRRGGIDNDCYSETFTGLRIPLGAAMQLRHTPLEFQLEFVPAFYTIYWGFGLEADLALAIRYYF